MIKCRLCSVFIFFLLTLESRQYLCVLLKIFHLIHLNQLACPFLAISGNKDSEDIFCSLYHHVRYAHCRYGERGQIMERDRLFPPRRLGKMKRNPSNKSNQLRIVLAFVTAFLPEDSTLFLIFPHHEKGELRNKVEFLYLWTHSNNGYLG